MSQAPDQDPDRIPISAQVTLQDLVTLIDMHAGVLVNPMQVYPQLVAAVGRFKARWMWAAALAIVVMRDDASIDETPAAEVIPAGLAVICGLIGLLLDGAASAGFLGATVTLFLVSLCHRLARAYRQGDL